MVTKADTTLYRGRRGWYVAGLVLAATLFAGTAWLAARHIAGGWEQRLFTRVNDWPDSWRAFFLTVTYIGGSVYAAAASVAVTFLLKMYRLAWRLAASIVLGYGLAFVAKHLVARPRPGHFLPAAHIRMLETGMGFPSGHSVIVAIVSLSVLPYLPKKIRWLVPVWIALVMLSRVYLGVHWPLDVVGGMAIGLGVVCFIRLMPQSLRVALRLD